MSRGSQQLELWLDAHFSKHLPGWIESNFDVRCRHLLGLGLRNGEDEQIFDAARNADAVFVTKDSDFIRLVRHRGYPPRLIHVRCGNASNAQLQSLFAAVLGRVIDEIHAGAMLITVDWPKAD